MEELNEVNEVEGIDEGDFKFYLICNCGNHEIVERKLHRSEKPYFDEDGEFKIESASYLMAKPNSFKKITRKTKDFNYDNFQLNCLKCKKTFSVNELSLPNLEEVRNIINENKQVHPTIKVNIKTSKLKCKDVFNVDDGFSQALNSNKKETQIFNYKKAEQIIKYTSFEDYFTILFKEDI